MPIYDSQCKQCNTTHIYTSSISDCTKTMPMCCGVQTVKQIFSVPMLNASTAERFQAHQCHSTGEIITSERQFKSVKAKHNLVDARDQNAGGYINKRNKIKTKRDNLRKNLDPMVRLTSRNHKAIGA